MEFFMMTGVKFMDELTIPRRSVHHPQLPDNTEGTPYLFEHYAVSHIEPQAQIHQHLSENTSPRLMYICHS